MYFYLYDSFLQDKKYERTVALIEARVADLGIKGRAMKLSVLQQLEESIHEAVDRGARTVVAVGNDKTINEAVSVVANYTNVTLGIIPVGESNEIAKILGIPLETAACDVISNRLIDIMDIGRVNGRFFFGKIGNRKWGNNFRMRRDLQDKVRSRYEKSDDMQFWRVFWPCSEP